ncbi:MAG: hypothetical protein ABH885_00845, partial [Candidatus Omnitrophota bacterium]
MTIAALRLFFAFLSVIAGYYIGLLLNGFDQLYGAVGAVIGVFGAMLLILVEILIRKFSTRNLSAAVFGLIFGFFMAWLLTLVLKLIPMSEDLYSSLQIVFMLVFCYLGMVIAVRGK